MTVTFDEERYPPGIYVVEFNSSPVNSRWVVIAKDTAAAALIVADKVMPLRPIGEREGWAEGLEVSRIGTYSPGPKGSRFGAVVAVGAP